jgi:hypothetical protein
MKLKQKLFLSAIYLKFYFQTLDQINVLYVNYELK